MTAEHFPERIDVAIIGAGPAGLMAAEKLAAAGIRAHVFDTMPTPGRKFMVAGQGGLNITHTEPLAQFQTRYGVRAPQVAAWLQGFGPQQVREWCAGLGVPAVADPSGRMFTHDMRATPLLRAWLQRLDVGGVQLHTRWRWTGFAAPPQEWKGGVPLTFATPEGAVQVHARAALLALGGASWPRVGTDGAWVPIMEQLGVPVAPLRPTNCGFDVAAQGGREGDGWTPFFAEHFAGAPLKNVTLRFADSAGGSFERKGGFSITRSGVSGGLIFAASALLRDEIERSGSATFHLDLLPERSAAEVLAEVQHPRGRRSLSTHLKSRLGLEGVHTALLHEVLPPETLNDAPALAAAIKALPIVLRRPRPIQEAISSAGGVRLEALDDGLQCRAAPGLFCAGEMLDWEAPPGGYLLTACLASGAHAAQGMARVLGAGACTTLK